jgi:hypothetical protein
MCRLIEQVPDVGGAACSHSKLCKLFLCGAQCRFRIVFSMDTKIAHYYWPETALLLYLIGLYYMEFEIWLYS